MNTTSNPSHLTTQGASSPHRPIGAEDSFDPKHPGASSSAHNLAGPHI